MKADGAKLLIRNFLRSDFLFPLNSAPSEQLAISKMQISVSKFTRD